MIHGLKCRNEFYIFTNDKDEDLNGFVFKTGLNEYLFPCVPYVLIDVYNFNFPNMVYVRNVTLPEEDELVDVIDNSGNGILRRLIRSTKIIVGEKRAISEYEWDWKLLIGSNGRNIRFLKTQTTELCKIAIENEPNSIEFVANPEPELCKLAVMKNPWTIRFMKNPSLELCKLAIKRNAHVLQCIGETTQTEELCMMAIKIDGLCLRYVKIQKTYEMCKIAVGKEPAALLCVDDQTPELCEIALRKYGLMLQFVEKKTYDLCKIAVENEAYALEFVDEILQTPELCKIALNKNSHSVKFIADQSMLLTNDFLTCK